MSGITTLRVNFIQRSGRRNGPIESKKFNDSMEELSTDLSGLQTQWNDKLIPLLDTVPAAGSGDGTDSLDAFTNGLDGSTLYVDADIATTSARYYNTTYSRPNTVKEQSEAIYTYVEGVRDDLRSEMGATVGGGLTSAQKSQIGDNIFDSTKSSISSSLDGLTSSNQSNITQLAKDLYGSVFSLNGDGAEILSIDVQTAVNAARAFTGMSNWGDNSPTYTSTTYISNGDSLEAAAGKLDAQVTANTGLIAALPASQVTVADSGGYFTSANVEAALAEMVGGGYTFTANLGVGTENSAAPKGTFEVFSSSGLFSTIQTAALPAGLDTSLLVSGEDGIVEIFGGQDGADAAWISLGEVTSAGALKDKWSLMRQTSGDGGSTGDSRLELLYGTSATPADNTVLMTCETDGTFNFVNSGMIHNGLYVHRSSEDVADDGSIDLPGATAGWGFVQAEDNEEYAQFCFTSAGVVTLVYNSANVVNTDTDTNLCIFDNGPYVRIRNRLGATKTIRYTVNYSAP